MFFGNGYNSPSQTPVPVCAGSARPGTSLPGTPINLCAQVPTACNTSLPNGLSSVVVVNSLGGAWARGHHALRRRSAGQRLARGHQQPKLARTGWCTLLFQATDPSGNPQPITTTPAVSLNPDFPRLPGTMVYVGTGQLLGVPDLSTTQVQTMYGIYDSLAGAAPLYTSDLQSEAMSATMTGGLTLRYVAGGQVALPSQNGWYVNFNLSGSAGERIVTNPQLDAGAVVVTSVIPNPSTCTSGDTAYLMEFNYAGGAFNNPQFNYDGSGSITSSLTAANGVLLGSVYASSPVFTNFAGNTNGAGGAVTLITLSNGSGYDAPSGPGGPGSPVCVAGVPCIPSFRQTGLQQQRFSWWEVR